MSKNESKKAACSGCRDNYYNYGDTSTSGECWMLKSAKMRRRWVTGTCDMPATPGVFREVEVYQCYNRKGEHYSDSIPSFAVDPIRLPKPSKATRQ